MKARGTAENPVNRFTPISYGADVFGDVPPDERSAPYTQFFRDSSRSILAENDSPDVGFSTGLNPYRGCEHGCIYCYARPTHEYLSFSAGLDFETKILVKENAPQLLRQKFMSPRWTPRVIAMSGVTDCYQPAERHFQLTRRCLEVMAEFRNPVVIITKNQLVTRDIDILQKLARFQAVTVYLSVTTLDEKLRLKLEPRTSSGERRLKAIETLSQAGIPTGILISPIIPGLNDVEIPQLLKSAAAAGARFAHYTLVRLPHGVADLFEGWLKEHFPDRHAKVMNKIKEMHRGKRNDSRFGHRMEGEGILADQLYQFFELWRRKLGFSRETELATDHFRRPLPPPSPQISLFG
jgi:DNA repair photolyase